MWHIFLADVFESFRNMCLKECELDPAHFLTTQGLAWQAYLKKTKIESELLTDIVMLLMVKKGNRGGICQEIQRQAKANYNKDVISSYLMYLDANNLYEWGMSQKLPVNGFKWVKRLSRFNKIFMKNYNENSDIEYFLEVDFDYSKNCLIFIKFTISTRNKKVDKVKKLICGIEDKEKYVILIRSLKQALNHGLVLRKVHRLIQFNQEDWLKP